MLFGKTAIQRQEFFNGKDKTAPRLTDEKFKRGSYNNQALNSFLTFLPSY
jgi:hypothetical protein